MAARLETIHLPHLIDGDAEVPAPVRRLAAHCGDVVRFASQVEPGHARRIPVACRFRPARRPCGGLLVVERQEPHDHVAWQCPNCGSAGVITGWQGTPADLRAMRGGARQDVREVPVTVEALGALREVARDDPALGRLAFTARVDPGGCAVLLVGDGERAHHVGLLTVAALGASRRAAGLLLSIVGALGEAAAPGAGYSRLAEFEASVASAILQLVLDLPDDPPAGHVSTGGRRRRTRRSIEPLRRSPAATFQIKVTLRDVRPPVWRRLLVPADIRLPKLHDVLQAAMGWQDCHLHLFRVQDDCYAVPGDWEPIGEDSRRVRLVDLAATKGARLVYEYDFGDGWTHDIVVEAVLPEPCPQARCTGGRRRCPPEDCGGPYGYEEFLAAMGDPLDERHDELCARYGDDFDPAAFDADTVDAALRAMATG